MERAMIINLLLLMRGSRRNSQVVGGVRGSDVGRSSMRPTKFSRPIPWKIEGFQTTRPTLNLRMASAYGHSKMKLILYLKPVKTQLLQYGLSPWFNDLEALLSNKSITLCLWYQGNIFLVLIQQSRYGDQYKLTKGHNPNFDKTKSKSPYQSGYQIFLWHAPPGIKLS